MIRSTNRASLFRDSPDDSRTGVNTRVFPAFLQDISEVRTATVNSDSPFNIKGNVYRLVPALQYRAETLLIRFFGTHAEYDRIDAEKV